MIGKDKISAQDIIDLLAERAEISKSSAEDFFKVFLTTIEDALLAGDSVKIKNFGTFKKQWVEPRKSVDVNTNEEIIIEGYYKISFLPFSTLKYSINKPFAHLEAVILDDDSNDSIKDAENVENPANENLRHFEEQAIEIKDLLSEIKSMNNVVEQEDATIIESPVSEDEDEKESETTEESSKLLEVAAISTVVDEPVVEKEPEAAEEKEELAETVAPALVAEPVVEKEPETAEEKQKTAAEKNNDQKPPKKKKCIWCIVLFVVLGLVIAFVLSYFFSQALKDKTNAILGIDKTTIPIETPKNIEDDFENIDQIDPIEITDSLSDESAADTVNLNDSSTIQPEEINTIPADNTYSEILDTVTLNSGSRLSLLARRYYGSPFFWVYIYEANKDKIPNPNVIPIGTEIKIPKMDPKTVDPNSSEAIEKAKEIAESYKN